MTNCFQFHLRRCVLDHADVGSALQHVGDIDGTVFLAMTRKAAPEEMAETMRCVHPSIAGFWVRQRRLTPG